MRTFLSWRVGGIFGISISSMLFFFAQNNYAESVKTPPQAVKTSLSKSSHPAVQDTCTRLSGKLESLSIEECLSVNLTPTGAKSVNGVSILMREFPVVAPQKPKARILLIGGIHGDELSSVSIVFRWMNNLNSEHAGLFHWHIVPAMNPDGVLASKASRTNANGVDLNRNFPTPNWLSETENYWKKTNQDPRRYPGKKPLSEPESQWLNEEIDRFKPDAIVALHAPYGLLDFDGPKNPPKKLGHLYLNQLGTYPGSLGNYAGIQRNIPVITIELPNAGIMPKPEQCNAIWADLVRWLVMNVNGSKPSLTAQN